MALIPVAVHVRRHPMEHRLVGTTVIDRGHLFHRVRMELQGLPSLEPLLSTKAGGKWEILTPCSPP